MKITNLIRIEIGLDGEKNEQDGKDIDNFKRVLDYAGRHARRVLDETANGGFETTYPRIWANQTLRFIEKIQNAIPENKMNVRGMKTD